jgi:hypothetical protein
MAVEVTRFAEDFQKTHGLQLTFAADAVHEILRLCRKEKRNVRAFCDERFHDFEYALKLIARNTGKNAFAVTKAIVDNPSQELSRLIAESFKPAP